MIRDIGDVVVEVNFPTNIARVDRISDCGVLTVVGPLFPKGVGIFHNHVRKLCDETAMLFKLENE